MDAVIAACGCVSGDAVAVSADHSETRWIERSYLLELVCRDVEVPGDESPASALMREPSLLIRVGAPSIPALDLPTYRARLARWENGEGPRLTGMRQFVRMLEALDIPARTATVEGATTTYVFVLDAAIARVLACVAVDAPPHT